MSCMFVTQVNKDIIFRRKVILSAALCGLFASLGWNVSQLGPSLLDLQLITKTALDEISYILVAFSVGFVLGVILAPMLMRKSRIFTVLIIVHVTIALATAVTPWCKWFGVMVAVFSLRGLCHGINNTGCNMLILKIWGKDNGPYMQALHLSFAIGALVSPLTMAPFLKRIPDMTNPETQQNCTVNSSLTAIAISRPVSGLTNLVENDRGCPSFLTVVNFTSYTEISKETTEETRIHGAFVISALFTIVSVIPFTFFVCAKENWLEDSQPFDKYSSRKLTTLEKTGAIAAIGSTFFLQMISEKSVVFFLPTYLVRYLQWPKVHGSYTMSLYWAAFSIGRLSGVFITKRFKMCHIVGFDLCALMVISVGLLITGVLKSSVGTWILIPLLGIFLSMILPSLLTWAEVDFFKCSGRLISFFMICKAIGTLCPPITLGYLIDLISPLWFCYTLVFISFVLFSVYIFLLCIAHKYRPKTVEISICTDM